jgi:hypothetical protein
MTGLASSLFDDMLGERAFAHSSLWGTAHAVTAADTMVGIDVPTTAYFAEALASLLWQAMGTGGGYGETMTFGPWIVTTETEVDWVAVGGDEETPVFEVLYKDPVDGETRHVATVLMNGLGG